MAIGTFFLGISLATSVMILVVVRLWYPASPHWRLAFYCATLSVFHFLEFWTAAQFNTKGATIQSFIPTTNWLAYILVHIFAFVECLVYRVLYWHGGFKPFPGPPISVVLGLFLVIVGQTVRTLAAIHVGSPINQNVKGRKKEGRVLVTTGIYSILRHPEYFGFFWWAIGTQVVLGNTLSFFAIVLVLWSFFAGRVKVEEEYLSRSFGRDFTDYKKRVGTKMPFIG
jgi:protein-S-isoprenylcysteine O-methyltransferase